MTSARVRPLLAISVPTVFALIVGLTHPRDLSDLSAQYWRDIHIVLLPVFPLIGAVPWLLARRGPRSLAIVAGIGGFGFGTFYTALDVLAGIGAGTVTLAGQSDAQGPLFRIGDALAVVGVVTFVIGLLAASASVIRRVGLRAVPGGLLAAFGGALILPGHVWFPIGTLALALLLAGALTLALSMPVDDASRPASIA